MKHWAISVAALYGLILAVLTVPVGVLAFPNADDPPTIYRDWGYWTWLLVMMLAQAALLAVPVRIASRRPVTRGSLLPTVLASGLMMGGMLAGAVFAVFEFARGEPDMEWRDVWCVFAAMALTWCLWSLIFFRLGRKDNPSDFVTRQSRTLLKGSILELLIAVPTHIVVRQRHQCCAGLMTFIGLAAGISVMLFSFGPAVFFLFVARWRRLHPAAAQAGESA